MIFACESTPEALQAIPPDAYKGCILAHVAIGGQVHETLDERHTKITYSAGVSLRGYIPRSMIELKGMAECRLFVKMKERNLREAGALSSSSSSMRMSVSPTTMTKHGSTLIKSHIKSQRINRLSASSPLQPPRNKAQEEENSNTKPPSIKIQVEEN